MEFNFDLSPLANEEKNEYEWDKHHKEMFPPFVKISFRTSWE